MTYPAQGKWLCEAPKGYMAISLPGLRAGNHLTVIGRICQHIGIAQKAGKLTHATVLHDDKPSLLKRLSVQMNGGQKEAGRTVWMTT